MRLDKFIENHQSDKKHKKEENNNLVIYDPENPDSVKRLTNAPDVVIFLPDNQRD